VTRLDELNAAVTNAILKAERASLEASKAWEAVMVLEEHIAKETAGSDDENLQIDRYVAVEGIGLAQRKAKTCWEMAAKSAWEKRHEP
jgi:hypothetical protein